MENPSVLPTPHLRLIGCEDMALNPSPTRGEGISRADFLTSMQDSGFPSPLAGEGCRYGRRNRSGAGEGSTCLRQVSPAVWFDPLGMGSRFPP